MIKRIQNAAAVVFASMAVFGCASTGPQLSYQDAHNKAPSGACLAAGAGGAAAPVEYYCRRIAELSDQGRRAGYEQDYGEAESSYTEAIACFEEAQKRFGAAAAASENGPPTRAAADQTSAAAFGVASCPNVAGYAIRPLTQLKADLANIFGSTRRTILATSEIDTLVTGYATFPQTQEGAQPFDIPTDWMNLRSADGACNKIFGEASLLQSGFAAGADAVSLGDDDISLLQMLDLHHRVPAITTSEGRMSADFARRLYANKCRQDEIYAEQSQSTLEAAAADNGAQESGFLRADQAVLTRNIGRMYWEHAWSVVLASAATSRHDLDLASNAALSSPQFTKEQASQEGALEVARIPAVARQTVPASDLPTQREELIEDAIEAAKRAISILLNQGPEVNSLVAPRMRMHLATLEITRVALQTNPIEGNAPTGAVDSDLRQSVIGALTTACGAYRDYQGAVDKGAGGDDALGASRETARVLRLLGAIQSAAVNSLLDSGGMPICGPGAANLGGGEPPVVAGSAAMLREVAIKNYVAAVEEYTKLSGVNLAYTSMWPFFRALAQKQALDAPLTDEEANAAFIAAQFVRGSSAAQRVGVQAQIDRAIRIYSEGAEGQTPQPAEDVRKDFAAYFTAKQRHEIASLEATASSGRLQLGGGSSRLAETAQTLRKRQEDMAATYPDFERRVLVSYVDLPEASQSVCALENYANGLESTNCSEGGGAQSHAFVLLLAERPQGVVFVVEKARQTSAPDGSPVYEPQYHFALTRPITANVYTYVEATQQEGRVATPTALSLVSDPLTAFSDYWYTRNISLNRNRRVLHPERLLRGVYDTIFEYNQSGRAAAAGASNSVSDILRSYTHLHFYVSESLFDIPLEMLRTDAEGARDPSWFGDQATFAYAVSTRNFVDKVTQAQSGASSAASRGVVFSGYVQDTFFPYEATEYFAQIDFKPTEDEFLSDLHGDTRQYYMEIYRKTNGGVITTEEEDGDYFDRIVEINKPRHLQQDIETRYQTSDSRRTEEEYARCIDTYAGYLENLRSIDRARGDAQAGSNGQAVQTALGLSDQNYYGPPASFDGLAAQNGAQDGSRSAAASEQSDAEFTWGQLSRLNEQGALKNYEIVHFNTHGVLPPELTCLQEASLTINGAQVGQPLGQSQAQSSSASPNASETQWRGWARGLPLAPASQLERLELDADLVTLAACNGAGGQSSGQGAGASDVSADSLTGLVVAFDRAGARNVIAGRWSVSENATALLMEAMYRALDAGAGRVSYADALAAAQMSMRHKGEGLKVYTRRRGGGVRPNMETALRAADNVISAAIAEQRNAANDNDPLPWWDNLGNAYYWGAFMLIGAGVDVLDAQPDAAVRPVAAAGASVRLAP